MNYRLDFYFGGEERKCCVILQFIHLQLNALLSMTRPGCLFIATRVYLVPFQRRLTFALGGLVPVSRNFYFRAD